MDICVAIFLIIIGGFFGFIFLRHMGGATTGMRRYDPDRGCYYFVDNKDDDLNNIPHIWKRRQD